MRAIVVREQGTHKLICFGPDNGMYDPGVPPNAYKIVEADYETVKAEDAANQPAPVDRRAALLAESRIPQWYKDFIL